MLCFELFINIFILEKREKKKDGKRFITIILFIDIYI
jgi:hypothetical protein